MIYTVCMLAFIIEGVIWYIKKKIGATVGLIAFLALLIWGLIIMDMVVIIFCIINIIWDGIALLIIRRREKGAKMQQGNETAQRA